MGKKGEKALEHAILSVKEKLKRDKLKKPKIKEAKPERKIVEKKCKILPMTLQRGVVYLGHIPHGFYEREIRSFFKQFGVVTRVRVARSKKSGRSRGYAYIQFRDIDVAKVAAETMDNYLMCGRLLRATYIPPEKQRLCLFFGPSITKNDYPKLHNVRKVVTTNRQVITKSHVEKKNQNTLEKLSALEEKLKAKGINLSFVPGSQNKKTQN